MKTLEKVEWKDLEIGEIFAWDGCWIIAMKTDTDGLLILANSEHNDDLEESLGDNRNEIPFTHGTPWESHLSLYTLYRLPKSIQRLWNHLR